MSSNNGNIERGTPDLTPAELPGVWPWQRIKGPFWTIANGISLARLPVALLAVTLYLVGWTVAAGLLVVVSFVTDALDGVVARLTGSVSDWGKVLDPISDKAVFATIGLLLVAEGRMPVWFFTLLLARDLFLVGGSYLFFGKTREIPAATYPGKATTMLFAIWMFKQLFWPAETTWFGLGVLGWCAFAMMVISTAVYVRAYQKSSILRLEGEAPGC